MIAVSNLAEAAEELAYTTDKADHLEIEWMNYLGGPSLNILESKLDQLIVQNLIPFEPTLGQFRITSYNVCYTKLLRLP